MLSMKMKGWGGFVTSFSQFCLHCFYVMGSVARDLIFVVALLFLIRRKNWTSLRAATTSSSTFRGLDVRPVPALLCHWGTHFKAISLRGNIGNTSARIEHQIFSTFDGHFYADPAVALQLTVPDQTAACASRNNMYWWLLTQRQGLPISSYVLCLISVRFLVNRQQRFYLS